MFHADSVLTCLRIHNYISNYKNFLLYGDSKDRILILGRVTFYGAYMHSNSASVTYILLRYKALETRHKCRNLSQSRNVASARAFPGTVSNTNEDLYPYKGITRCMLSFFHLQTFRHRRRCGSCRRPHRELMRASPFSWEAQGEARVCGERENPGGNRSPVGERKMRRTGGVVVGKWLERIKR